ncbi:MAG: lipopolysaccharide kinase InaA family protein [Candidatus Methylomirabilales bacterium]
MKNNLHLVHMPIDGVRWLVAEPDRKQLAAAARAGWEGQVHRVTVGRRVVRVDGMEGPVVLKHFYDRGLAAALKGLVCGSPASQEWAALHKARRLGLPVPRPVALGVGKGILQRESFLVTEALEGTIPLGATLFGENCVRGQGRWEIIRGAARVLRKMHDAGVTQRDLHLGNILVRSEKDAAEFFLIDLQRAQVGTRVSEAIRWRDLATLQGGCLEAGLTDRLRFLKAYLGGPPPLSIELKSLVAGLLRRGFRHRIHLWRSRGHRCVGDNQEFCPVRVRGHIGFARRASWGKAVHGLFEDPQGPLGQPGVHLVKDSRTTTVGLLPSTAGGLFIKRYNFQSLGYALKDVFRAARARRVWIIANSLRMRGIPTPLPHAYLEYRRARVLLESYLITEGVEGVGLLELADRFREAGVSLLLKRQLIQQIATLLRHLHARGVSHRDLKGQNILVREDDRGRFWPLLVDLDGVRLGRVSWRRRRRDLARLAWAFLGESAVTKTDRVRFLKQYLGPTRRRSWKKLWRGMGRMQVQPRR